MLVTTTSLCGRQIHSGLMFKPGPFTCALSWGLTEQWMWLVHRPPDSPLPPLSWHHFLIWDRVSFGVSRFAICEVLQWISYVVEGRMVEGGREGRKEWEGGKEGEREGEEEEEERERESPLLNVNCAFLMGIFRAIITFPYQHVNLSSII